MVIPYSRQSINRADISAVEEVLQSDYLTQGPMVSKFEEEVARYCGATYGVAANSGTSALHIACYALGVGEGDWVWTSPNSFVASANCARYCNAKVDFIDIDPETGNICIDALERKCKLAAEKGTLPKVVIPVDFAGQPCQLEKVSALAKQYNFSIIEDASHAFGSTYCGHTTGSGYYADITVFSFHPVKILTCGEGGVAVTNDEELARKMRSMMSHCITREKSLMTNGEAGGWYYQQLDLGYNYRLSDIHAALGLSQLERVDQFIDERNRLALNYHQFFETKSTELVSPLALQSNCRSSYHLYVIKVKNEQRDLWYQKLKSAEILVNVHYIPIYSQPYYQRCFQEWNITSTDYPNMSQYYSEALSIPLFPGMSEEEQQHVMTSIDRLCC